MIGGRRAGARRRIVVVAVSWGVASVLTATASPGCSSSASTDTDASAEDAAADVHAGRDSGSDAGDEPDAAPVCAPTKPASVPAQDPRTPDPGACTSDEVGGYYYACIERTGAVCDAYKAAHATCFRCIDAQETDATSGPLVWYAKGAFFDFGLGACIATVRPDATGVACGKALTQLQACESLACENNCGDLQTKAGFDALVQCTRNADDEACASFVADYDVKCASQPGASCFEQKGEADIDFFTRLATLFCSTSPDAGGDAAAD